MNPALQNRGNAEFNHDLATPLRRWTTEVLFRVN